MGNYIKPAVIASGLFFSALTLSAQTYSGNSPYRNGPTSYGLQLCDRVQSDLSRAAYESYGSRRRIDHAHKEVAGFENRLSRGDFSRRDLDEAIGSVRHVVESNAISGQSRAALLEDLDRMRDFRASNGRF